jgi:hypothetical protein
MTAQNNSNTTISKDFLNMVTSFCVQVQDDGVLGYKSYIPHTVYFDKRICRDLPRVYIGIVLPSTSVTRRDNLLANFML